MERFFTLKNWLLYISLLVVFTTCKSNKSVPESTPPDSVAVEHPRPGTDANLDSLKRSLDEQRRLKKKK